MFKFCFNHLHRHNSKVIISRCMATNLKDYESHYDTLEVAPECTKTEIRESWLKLSMQYHPDLNKDDEDATQKFMAIKEAYKVLVNDEQRKVYNDKIGFRHADPPPDYNKEWTLQGEKDSNAARGYAVMWSEEQIREMMSSAKLRDVNWDKQTPAERYRILQEESRKVMTAKGELEALNTPTIREGRSRYFLMVTLVCFLHIILQVAKRNASKQHIPVEVVAENMTDYETSDGTLINKMARVKQSDDTWLDDPRYPDRYWLEPGALESPTGI